MHNVKKRLEEAMEQHSTNTDQVRIMNELFYSASETGIIPFSFHEDETIASIMQLVRLGDTFEDISEVDDELRL